MRTSSILLPLASVAMAVAADVKPLLQNTTAVPRHFAFLVAPSITPIDMFGPMDVLTAISMYYQNNTGKMHMSVLTATDKLSTTVAPTAGNEFGTDLTHSITIDEYRKIAANNFSTPGCKNSEKGPIDVLLVPGGGGTRGNVSAEIAFVKELYPSLKYIISVCTGSTIPARAGVFDNKHATTNKKAWAWASQFGKNVTYRAEARWVKDGNVYSSSGVSAGTDATYAFVADVYGEEVSHWIADASEYTRWSNASFDPFAARWGAKDNVTAA
jgi:putative intracellular protease/amidase